MNHVVRLAPTGSTGSAGVGAYPSCEQGGRDNHHYHCRYCCYRHFHFRRQRHSNGHSCHCHSLLYSHCDSHRNRRRDRYRRRYRRWGDSQRQ